MPAKESTMHDFARGLEGIGRVGFTSLYVTRTGDNEAPGKHGWLDFLAVFEGTQFRIICAGLALYPE